VPPETQNPGYRAVSRPLVNSLILVTPLFVLYQVGILTTDGWYNAADFITARLYALTGRSTPWYVALNLVILASIILAARFLKSSVRPTPVTFGMVLLESAIYAVFLGGLLSTVLIELGLEPPRLSLSTWDNLVLSAGAGAYEELVFRLLLFSGLVVAGTKLKLKRAAVLLGAFIVSSALFSAFHYPPMGEDSWELWSFSFRFGAGLIFAGIFVLRGFAVAAYTHAIYDVYVLVL
jgi:hypothetical protein